MHDVHVWGDSHWRNFFPFVNHGSPGVVHEQDGIRMIDMVANELSGATMYGLLNDNSKNGARRRILGDLDRIGPVENVGLVFGEVDVRYHYARYFRDGGLMLNRVLDLFTRFMTFIEEDLLASGRVTGRIFIYSGFHYPKGPETLLQPGIPIGVKGFEMAQLLNCEFEAWMRILVRHVADVIHCPVYDRDTVSDDGVHLRPELIFPRVFDYIRRTLRPDLTEWPF